MQNNTFFGHYTPSSVIVLEEIHSTNDYLKLLLSKFKPQRDLTAIMAKHQNQGKGQRGTVWITQPNTNLTVSIAVNFEDMLIENQFFVSVIASLAMYDTVKELTNKTTYIKWPNDILVNKKKICGILIENRIRANYITESIVGIGLNVLQTEFAETIKHKATSFRLEQDNFNMPFLDIIKKIQQHIYKYKTYYKAGHLTLLLAMYNEKLLGRNETLTFSIQGKETQGIITQVGKDGLLQVRHENNLLKYDLKDIVYKI